MAVIIGGSSTGSSDFVNVKNHGVAGDGSTDDTAALASVLASCVANKTTAFLPDGTYLINSPASVLLPLTGGVRISGSGRDRVTIKLGPAITQWYAIVGSSSSSVDLTGLSVEGITFDCNSSVNGWTSATVSQRTSGYPRYVVSAYQGSRLSFTKNRVTNFDGSNAVCFNTAAGANPGADATVNDNIFDNIGTSTVYHDHSTIYVDMLRSTVAHNTCVGTASTGSNAICALEIHGGNQHVHDNKVVNYIVGGNIVSSLATKATGVSKYLWHDNTFVDVAIMVQPWILADSADLIVEDNIATIDPDRWSGGISVQSRFCGLSGSQMTAAVSRLRFERNHVTFKASTSTTFTSTDHGVYIPRATAPDIADTDWVIDGNHFENLPGSGIYLSGFAGLAGLSVRRNTFRNIGTAQLGSLYQECLVVAGSAGAPIDDFLFANNKIIDSQTTHTLHSAVFIATNTVMNSPARILDNQWRVADGSTIPFILYNQSTSATPLVRHSQLNATGVVGQIAAGSTTLDEATGYTKSLQNNTINMATRLNLAVGSPSLATLLVNGGATTTQPFAQFKDVAGNVVVEVPNDQSGLRRLGAPVMAWRGAWAPSTTYYPGDVVLNSGQLYIRTGTPFTSTSSFVAGNWTQMF